MKAGARVLRRVIRTKPSPNYDAGDRFGCLPEVMALGLPRLCRSVQQGQSKQRGYSHYRRERSGQRGRK